MLISLAVGETYEVNGVPITIRPPTRKHVEVYVEPKAGANIQFDHKAKSITVTKSN